MLKLMVLIIPLGIIKYSVLTEDFMAACFELERYRPCDKRIEAYSEDEFNLKVLKCKQDGLELVFYEVSNRRLRTGFQKKYVAEFVTKNTLNSCFV
jgi:hypothetical protein